MGFMFLTSCLWFFKLTLRIKFLQQSSDISKIDKAVGMVIAESFK